MRKYQVFVSSTYEDLKRERREVMRILLTLNCIPAGMELFPAVSEEQWRLIEKVIDDCDYYIVIVGHRYGTPYPSPPFNLKPDLRSGLNGKELSEGLQRAFENVGGIKLSRDVRVLTKEKDKEWLVIDDGSKKLYAIEYVIEGDEGRLDIYQKESYTRKEYDYAVRNGKPILHFLYEDPDKPFSCDPDETDEEEVGLALFRSLVRSKAYRPWESTGELAGSVSQSLLRLIADKPADGWIRGLRARNIKCREFVGKFLTFNCMKEAADALWGMVDISRFDPDIIIGLNRGGLLIATAMHVYLRKPVGFMHIIRTKDGSEVQHISLPCNIGCSEEEQVERVKTSLMDAKRILLVDAKLKSGKSAKVAKEALHCIYGQRVDIRYAFALVYTGELPSRRECIVDRSFWPAALKFQEPDKDDGFELDVYAAYYVNVKPAEDDIWEELRHPEGW